MSNISKQSSIDPLQSYTNIKAFHMHVCKRPIRSYSRFLIPPDLAQPLAGPEERNKCWDEDDDEPVVILCYFGGWEINLRERTKETTTSERNRRRDERADVDEIWQLVATTVKLGYTVVECVSRG